MRECKLVKLVLHFSVLIMSEERRQRRAIWIESIPIPADGRAEKDTLCFATQPFSYSENYSKGER